MSSGAVSSEEAWPYSMSDVARVVGRIEGLPVPASSEGGQRISRSHEEKALLREVYIRTNTTRADSLWKVEGVCRGCARSSDRTGVCSCEAPEGGRRCLCAIRVEVVASPHRIAYEHTESLSRYAIQKRSVRKESAH